MKYFLQFLLGIAISSLLFACGNEVNQEKKIEERKGLNLIVILDLSSRLSKNKDSNQIDKDKILLKQLSAVFEERQKHFGFITSKDKLNILIADQISGDINKFKYKNDLTLIMSNKTTMPVFKNMKKEFLNSIDLIYSDAKKNVDAGKTSGADIWTTLKDKIPAQLLDTAKYANKIIILTDGYLDFDKKINGKNFEKDKGTSIDDLVLQKLRKAKDNWNTVYANKKMGLKAIDKDFKNAEIIVTQINPRNIQENSNEQDILEFFWQDWLKRSNIKLISFNQNTSNDNLNRILSDFIK